MGTGFAGDASRVCFGDEYRKVFEVRSPDVVGVISSEFDCDVRVIVVVADVCLCSCHDENLQFVVVYN